MPHALPPRPARAQQQPRRRVREVAVIALLAIGVALLLGVAMHDRIARPLPAAVLETVPCVSYAPFRRPGHTPFDADRVVSPAEIEDDLARLRRITGCVRTYGVDQGLDAVPAIAGRLGMRVALGAWIGRDPAANAAQVDRAVALARAHPGVVHRLVIGNEVLLRRELSAAALVTWIERARRGAPVPVTYADVWEFWDRHADVLRPAVDLVAIHVLPYWEDQPVAIDAAADHVHTVAARLQTRFEPLPVWVAETGWPAAGRQRGAAAPGRAEQSRFVRELLARESGAALQFNLIEGFDQPWKRSLEGAMGGAWGLFDAAGRPRVPLAGPLPADPTVAWPMLAGGAGAAAGLSLAAMANARRRRTDPAAGGGTGPRVLATGALAGAGLGLLALLQAEAAVTWSRTPIEWAVGGGWWALSLIVGVGAAARVVDRVAGRGLGAVHPGVQRAWTDCLSRGQAGLLFALLFLTAVHALWLVFDGRYRALSWPATLGPAVLIGALAVLGDRLDRRAAHERLLAAVLAGGAVALLVIEGMANAPAIVTAFTWLALAASVGRAPLAGQDPQQGAHAVSRRDVGIRPASTSEASKTAGADKPAL